MCRCSVRKAIRFAFGFGRRWRLASRCTLSDVVWRTLTIYSWLTADPSPAPDPAFQPLFPLFLDSGHRTWHKSISGPKLPPHSAARKLEMCVWPGNALCPANLLGGKWVVQCTSIHLQKLAMGVCVSAWQCLPLATLVWSWRAYLGHFYWFSRSKGLARALSVYLFISSRKGSLYFLVVCVFWGRLQSQLSGALAWRSCHQLFRRFVVS